MKKKIPGSVNFVAWFTIIISIVFLALAIIGNIGGIFAQFQSLPPYFYYTTYAVTIVSFVCGIYMLKAQSWSRMLYVVANVVGILVLVSASQTGTHQNSMVGVGLYIIVFIILMFLLFNSKANAYFNPKK